MARCIFCYDQLDQTTKPEHILHDALGGRKTTRTATCSACNNLYGGTIDKVFVEQFTRFRNLLQLRSGSGELPPKIMNVKAGGLQLDILGDGRLRHRGKPFRVFNDANGQKQLEINAVSLEQIDALMPHMAAAAGLPEAELRKRIAASNGSLREQRPHIINFSFQFGGKEANRSVAKSCLTLWATFVGNAAVQRPEYDNVRRFIRGEYDDFQVDDNHLDSRTLPIAEQIVAAYGPVFNLIYIRSDAEGRVVGHFTAYNLAGFSVVLAQSGGLPNRQVALVCNPLTGEWSDSAVDKFDVPFAWLNQPDFDDDTMDRTRNRLEAIMKLHGEQGRDREVGRIVSEALARNFTPGEMIEGRKAHMAFAEIANRMARHLAHLPYTRELSSEELYKAFLKEKVDELPANGQQNTSPESLSGTGGNAGGGPE